MRYIGLAAFGATVCILVPLTLLDAGPTERAKLMAPDTHDLVVDGAHVTATIDHPFGEPNEQMHLTLTSDKQVELGIVVMGSSGTEGARVPDPPRPVAHRTITLVPDKTGKATKDVAIRLQNARAMTYQPYGTYTFYVMSPKAGARLQKLLDRAGPSVPTGEIPDMDTDTSKLFETISAIDQPSEKTDDEPDDRVAAPDAALFAKGSVAVLTAFSRPVQDEVKLQMPDRAAPGKPFAVTVTVHNTNAKPLADVSIALDPMTIGDTTIGLSGSDVEIEQLEPVTLAANEHKTVQIHVTAPYTGVLGLHATASCKDYCDNRDKNLRIGTFDAVEIVAEDAQVAKQ